MAFVAGGTHILIVPHFADMVVIGVGPVVFMAVDALERAEVGRNGVALAAGGPSVPVRSGVNREVLGIVIPRRGSPARGCVARLARC